MNIRSAFHRIILICAILLLFLIAWAALSGGISQLHRTLTVGQYIETAVQLICALLSVLSAVTCFYWKQWRRRVRIAWVISLTAAAGMSSLVWGPPMMGVGLAFAAAALLAALGIIKLMQIGGA